MVDDLAGWMFFSFLSHTLPVLCYSTKLCTQHFLGGTTVREEVLRTCWTLICCTGCDKGTKCKCVKTFVEMIGTDSLEQQVQRHLLILGKWCLCSLYLAKRANNRLAFCGYEPIPTVFKCQNTEEA